MSPTLRKVLYSIALVLAAIAIGLGLYYFFTGKNPITQIVGGPTPVSPTGTFPISGNQTSTTPFVPISGSSTFPIGSTISSSDLITYYQPQPVSQIIGDPVAFASINAGGALRYHNDTDGKFYQVLPDGSVKLMVDQVFYDVQKVTWAKAQDKAVLEYPDGSKIVYNFETKKQTTLPKHWEDFSFSPDGNELAAKSMTLAPENRWLITTKEDGTETKLIEPMGDYADRVSVNWSPSRQTVAFSQTGEPIGYDRRDILMVGINGENFKPMTVEGLDFIPQWSPTGQKLLYSVDSARSNFKPELWVASAYGDQIGANRRSIKVNTWANKCTFADDNTLFCAVPRVLPDGAGISPEVASGSYDDFYKIDLITGTKTPIPVNQDHRVDSISYNKQKNKIFFTDSSVRGIFEVPL